MNLREETVLQVVDTIRGQYPSIKFKLHVKPDRCTLLPDQKNINLTTSLEHIRSAFKKIYIWSDEKDVNGIMYPSINFTEKSPKKY